MEKKFNRFVLVAGRTLGLEQIHEMRPGDMLILNTVDFGTGHWNAVYCFTKTKKLFYDSYGFGFNDLYESLNIKHLYNTEHDAEQGLYDTKYYKENNCGQRCLAFLFVCMKTDFKTAVFI